MLSVMTSIRCTSGSRVGDPRCDRQLGQTWQQPGLRAAWLHEGNPPGSLGLPRGHFWKRALQRLLKAYYALRIGTLIEIGDLPLKQRVADAMVAAGIVGNQARAVEYCLSLREST